MHAVVVRVSISDFERGRQFLMEQIVPRAKEAPGFVTGYWTRSEEGDNGLSMMVFESEQAAANVMQMMQSQPVMADGVTLDGVEVREVVASA